MVGIGEGAGGAGVAVMQGPAPDHRSKGPHHRSGGRLSVRVEVGLDCAQVRENLGLLRSDQQLPVAELPGREPEEVEACIDGDERVFAWFSTSPRSARKASSLGSTCRSRTSFDGAVTRTSSAYLIR